MNKSNNFFSIVIPTYNHADFLLKALQSVIDQNHQAWEAIVIDNHSSDNTDEVIQKLNDPRIKLHKINNNGVIGASRNLGIKLSSYDWVAFLDSDDIWYPGRLNEISNLLSTTNKYDVISTDEYKVFQNNKNKKLLQYGPLPKNAYKHMLLYGNRLSPSATIVRKSLLVSHNISFNEDSNFITVEDYDFWLNIAFVKARFKFIPSIQGEYLVHSSNNSSRADIHHKNHIYLLKHHTFNVQKFSKDKEKLWKRIKTRLTLHDSIYKLRERNITSFLEICIKAFLMSPFGLFQYISSRITTKFFKATSIISYKKLKKELLNKNES